MPENTVGSQGKDSADEAAPNNTPDGGAGLSQPETPELPLTRRMRVPWQPRLTSEEVKRGLSYYGSGDRLERVAAKLMAGRPIKIFTLGGSVTKGQGSTATEAAYPAQLFDFIKSNFPNE